jgi:hypothetical protein
MPDDADAIEKMIEANRALRGRYEALVDKQQDVLERLWRALLACIVGLLAFAVLFVVLLTTHISSDACTEWTVMVRDATHKACCKGEIECPPTR